MVCGVIRKKLALKNWLQSGALHIADNARQVQFQRLTQV